MSRVFPKPSVGPAWVLVIVVIAALAGAAGPGSVPAQARTVGLFLTIDKA